jgi:GAF domain-containing protein
MINQWLRRLSVRQRIFITVGILVIVMVLSIPLLIINENQLLREQQTTTQVVVQVERLLLQASVRLASSRVNLLRYLDGSAPTLDAALSNIDQALGQLETARELADAEQAVRIRDFRLELAEYQTLIAQIEGANLEGDEAATTRLQGQVLAMGDRLGEEIAQMVQLGQQRLAESNAELRARAMRRVVGLAVVYAVMILVALGVAVLSARSITTAVDTLRMGAERFGRGEFDSAIELEGRDELSFLSGVLNTMASRVARVYHDLEQRVADRTEDLQRRSDYLQAVIGVSRATTDILALDDLLQRAVDVILQRFDLYYVGLFLLDDQGDRIVLRAGTGEAGRTMLARGHELPYGQGMIGWAVANGQARISQEAGEDQVRYANPALPDTRSEAAIPLRVRGQVIGALTVQDDEIDAFDAEVVDLLQVMADLLATTIENARLYTETQRALDAAQRAYGEMTREGWRRILQDKTAGYQAGTQGGLKPVEGTWSPEMVRAREARNVVRAEDERTLAVPISTRGQAIGAVRLQKPEGKSGWTDRELTLIQTVTEQLGIALDSARLYEDTQLSAARERIAREVTDRMRATLDWDELMRTAVQEIGQVVQASRAFVQWMPPDGSPDGGPSVVRGLSEDASLEEPEGV